MFYNTKGETKGPHVALNPRMEPHDGKELSFPILQECFVLSQSVAKWVDSCVVLGQNIVCLILA